MHQHNTDVRVEVILPRELVERFRIVAREEDRSMRSHLRHLVRQAVTNSEALGHHAEGSEKQAVTAAGDARA